MATAVLGVMLASNAAAQCNGGASCIVPVVATANVNAVARLSINNGSSATTTLNAPKAADFQNAAGVNSPGPTLNVMANASYVLTATAAASTWSGPSGSSKPATDLKMSVGGGAAIALGQVGSSTTGTATTNYVIGYNTIYNWTTDAPGSYTLVINYTLVAP